MSSRSITFGLFSVLALLLWLFTGVERIAREHGESNYELFTKQTPNFQIVFENTAQCGECDLRPWSLMSQTDRERFADYCAARFGLKQTRLCYAIFTEKQRMSLEQSIRSAPAQ